MISEAEADDIVLINKRRKSGKRISHPSELGDVFNTLGSNLNPILTQIAKTRPRRPPNFPHLWPPETPPPVS
jgi:hypothetical protein